MLGGVVEVVGLNLARDEIFIVSIDSVYISLKIYVWIQMHSHSLLANDTHIWHKVFLLCVNDKDCFSACMVLDRESKVKVKTIRYWLSDL